MQGLGGLAPGLNRGATMSGNKGGSYSEPDPIKLMQLGQRLSDTAFSLTIASPGVYQIVLDGIGGDPATNAGGGAGAKCVKSARLRKGEVVSGSLGGNSGGGTPSTLTLPDGLVMTANKGGNASSGVGGIGGTATGGDFNLSGANGLTTGSSSPGGANASYGGLVGGASDCSPGGGGSAGGGGTPGRAQIIITKIGD